MKEQFVIETWKRIGKDVVGAAELELISRSVIEQFGTPMSPALIARTLADEGARLGHPEILGAYLTWREGVSLFTPDDLTFGTLDAANALIEKIERLQDDPSAREHLRQSVLQIKTELELLASNRNTVNKDLAEEVAQWLTVWLQNPQIFPEWLSLRRAAPDFCERFGRG
ncbi:MAG TPA: hypothetical protein VJ875_03630 [Pyrinomonadaceae bacterium]|nr:hypothetical protein [Pyrinomonadaceae bacterium]